MVNVPARATQVVLESTVYPTDPLPWPMMTVVMRIQPALLAVKLLQRPVTSTVPLLPAAPSDTALGAMATADWFTVKVCPAIVSIPERALPLALGSTV